LIVLPSRGRIVFNNSSLGKEETMKTVRWIGVLGLAVWCVGAGAAAGSDGQPVKAEIKTGINGHAKGTLKVNINEANTADLMTLDGVSAGVARRIIAYREAHGPFRRAHDLEKVPGVGKAVLDKNHGRIAVK